MNKELNYKKIVTLLFLGIIILDLLWNQEDMEDLLLVLSALFLAVLIPIIPLILYLRLSKKYGSWWSLFDFFREIKNELEPSEKVDSTFKDLEDAFHRKDYSKALHYIKAIRQPGLPALSEENFSAMLQYESKIKLYIEKRLYLANGYKNAEAFSAAIEIYEEVLSIDRNSYEHLVRTAIPLSEACLEIGVLAKIKIAIEALTEARKQSRSNARQFNRYRQVEKQLFLCYARVGEPEKANRLHRELNKENTRINYSFFR